MADEESVASLFRADVERFSSRSVAAVTARLATRFFCFGSEPDDATRVISRLWMFASGEEADVSGLPARALPKYVELSGRGAHVFDQCGLVLGALNKYAHSHDTDEARSELSDRLLDAIGAALKFGPKEGGDLICQAINDDVETASRMGSPTSDPNEAPVDPSERGPLGILWPTGSPKWWRPAD